MGAKLALAVSSWVDMCVLLLSDVNVAFQQSAHKVLLDDDNLLPLLHLTIEYHGKEHKGIYTCSFNSELRWEMMTLFSNSVALL